MEDPTFPKHVLGFWAIPTEMKGSTGNYVDSKLNKKGNEWEHMHGSYEKGPTLFGLMLALCWVYINQWYFHN